MPVNKKICDRCGREIGEGGDFYEVDIVIKAGFNGVIKETEEKLDEIVSDINTYSEEELEKMIYERKTYILCVRCKEVWIANPFLKPL